LKPPSERGEEGPEADVVVVAAVAVVVDQE